MATRAELAGRHRRRRRRRRPRRIRTPGRRCSQCVCPAALILDERACFRSYWPILRCFGSSPAEEDADGSSECVLMHVRGAAGPGALTRPATCPPFVLAPTLPPDPIRFGFTPRPLLPQPPSTSPARTSTSTAARPNSSASPPAAPARVSLPFENGSDGSGETEVERVTLRRQKRDRPVAASTTTVEKFLQSGKVAEATQQLAKGKGKVVKRLAGRPGNSRSTPEPDSSFSSV